MCLLLAACTGSSSGSGPSGSPPAPVSGSSAPTSIAPSTATVTAAPTSSAAVSSPSSSTGSSSRPAGRVAPKLTDFRMVDATFVGSEEWVLGAAHCLSGGGNSCSAIEHSSDGGTHWASLPTPVTTVVGPSLPALGCSGNCVQYIRFATTKVGYLYSSTALYLTTDGGLHWSLQQGGAAALESLDGNVIRIVTDTPECPPHCTFEVQTAPVGGTSWHTVHLPGQGSNADSTELTRTGGWSYLVTFQNPAGGAERAHATLFASSDNGQSWTNRGEPCPQEGKPEVDATALSTAPGGAVGVACQSRGSDTAPQYVAVSTNHARSFAVSSARALGSAYVTALALATRSTVLVVQADTFRSTDSGRRFARLGADAGSTPGVPFYLGFATSSLGHAISGDGRTLFTTTDAGATWTGHRFA